MATIDRIASLKRQITELEKNLLLIDERKSEYAQQVDIPLQLKKEEGKTRTQLTELQAQLGALENDQQRRISHSILPWLVNRSEQLDELAMAFRQLQAQPNRPLVCLLHGDDQECHDKFVDRLKEVALADLLPDIRVKSPIRRIALDWPTRTQTVDELHEKLAMRLGEAIQDIQANLVEINVHLSASPVLVETYLLIQEWQSHTSEQINGFVQFWQKWPPLAPGQYLIVCLCIKCIKPKTSLLTFWRRHSIAEMLYEVERALVDRSRFPFDRHDRVLCKVLPRLQAVTLQEAHNWPLLQDVKRHCPGRDLVEDLKMIFDNNPTKTVPMRELGRRLGELLSLAAPIQEEE